MSECCPRCRADAIDVDPIEGWPVCHACGYLPPEASENLSSFQEESHVGRRVHEDGLAHGAFAAGGGAFHQGVGRERNPNESKLRNWHVIEEKVKAMGNQLRLSSPVVLEACRLLDEYRKMGQEDSENTASLAAASANDPPTEGLSSRHLSPVTPGLIGAALYAAARKASLGLIIHEVAEVAQVNNKVIGKYFNRIAKRMGKLPPGSLRGLVVRHAAQIVSRLYHGRESSQDEGRNVHLHPFMQTSKDLADLVSALHVAESKPNNVLSAALFELAGEAVKPPALPLGSDSKTEGFHSLVLSLTGSNKTNVMATKKVMRAQLLEFARTLPFGAVIHKNNLISFLPAIKDLFNTISLIKKTGTEEGGRSLKRAREDEGEGEGEEEGEDARVILGLMTIEELREERKREKLAIELVPEERRSTWDKLKGTYI